MRLFENALKMHQLRVLLGSQYISRNLQILRGICRGSAHLCTPLTPGQGPHTCAPTLAPQVKTLWPAQRALSKETRTTSGRCYSAQSTSPEDGILIYTGNLGKTVLGVKFFSYSSSMFSLCVMPYIMMKNGMGVSSFTMKVAFCGVIGFFTFITPVLLHLITKGYVVRLYHNKETDTYTAVTYSAFLTQKKTVFHQSDVRIPDVSSMFTSFYVKKQSMLLNPMLFDLPHDYNHLMGYDQPFSFDMEEVNKPDKN